MNTKQPDQTLNTKILNDTDLQVVWAALSMLVSENANNLPDLSIAQWERVGQLWIETNAELKNRERAAKIP